MFFLQQLSCNIKDTVEEGHHQETHLMWSGLRARASLSLFLWLTDFGSTYLQIKPVAESKQTCVCGFFPLHQGDQHLAFHYLLLLPAKCPKPQASKCDNLFTPLPYHVKFQDAQRDPLGGSSSCGSQIVTIFIFFKGMS